MKYKLSVVIPSRNEEFLKNTVEDILKNKRGDTQIIVCLDGKWSEPPLEDHKDVVLLYRPEAVGQRAGTNLCVKMSSAKYILKADAHTAWDEGFDVKMIEAFESLPDGESVTMVPIMRNLHCFNWLCPDGHSRYQGPSGPCQTAGCNKPTRKDVVWIPKLSPQSKSYCFDSEPHFQYFREFNKRPEGKPDTLGLTETMSLQGSAFMLTREKYWELNICDEAFGSWGSQGIEVAAKTWLSGGRVLVNHKTWYGHMFRTQGGDFSFPYPQSGRNVQNAKKMAGDLFFDNKWPLQKLPLSWLLDKFWPVDGWTPEARAKITKAAEGFVPAGTASKKADVSVRPTKNIIFYTDNRLSLKIAQRVQSQLRQISKDKEMPIISASLKPMSKMGKNVYVPRERGIETYFTQIVAALEASDADIVYFAEHDVLYSPTHFDFTPPDRTKFYYDQNWWKLRLTDGFAVHWDADQVAGLVCYRDIALEWYRNKLATFRQDTFDRKYEPMSGMGSIAWKSETPSVDFRHGGNLTKNKWSIDDFRDKRTCVNWEEGYNIPWWGETREVFKDILTGI